MTQQEIEELVTIVMEELQCTRREAELWIERNDYMNQEFGG